ncbi:MAG: hypothetical protein QM594_11380 [Niabella sp.]
MAIILDADELFSTTYGGYLQEHLFRALAGSLPQEKFLFPQTGLATGLPSNMQEVAFPPKKGLFLRKKTRKWLQELNATAFISFKRTLTTTSQALQQVLIIGTEAQLDDATTILSADAIGLTSKYLRTAFEKKYPNLVQKSFPAEGIVDPLQLLQDFDSQHIKDIFTEGNEYFICTDFNLDKEQLVILLKGFSAFKKRLQSNWKLMIALRSAEPAKHEAAALLLAHYKYRADVVLTGGERLYEKIAGAYSLVSMDSREIFPVPVAEAAKVQIPAIAPATHTLKGLFEDAVMYPADNSSSAIGDMLMKVYKEESSMQRLKGKLEHFQFRLDVNAAVNALVKVLHS